MAGWIERLAGAAPDASGRALSSEPRAQTSARWAAVALLGLVLLFWVTRILGGQGEKALDAFEYHYPSYLWLYGELASGRLPLWNPYQLCGIPTLATLQSGALYPPHALYLVLPVSAAMAISGLLHLLLAAFATLRFGLRAGLGAAPALLAALLVSLRGAQPGQITNPSMQESGAWLAVGFLGVLALARGQLARGCAVLGLATGMSLLCGFPQYSVYSAYAWLFVLAVLLSERARRARAPLALAVAVAGIALGAGLAAVTLLPALELTAVGGRARGVLDLELMLPLGGAGFSSPLEALRTATESRPAMPGLVLSFGLAGLLWLPLSRLHPQQRRLGVAMSLLALAALLFAMGPSTPLFGLLLHLPEVGSFRIPWRALMLADFGIAVAAAVGLDAVLRRAARPSAADAGARGSRIAGALAVLAVVAAVLEPFTVVRRETRLPYDAASPLLRPYHEPREVLDSLSASPDRVFTMLLGDLSDVSEKFASAHRLRSISDYEILTLRRQREYFSWLFWGELEPRARNWRGHSQRVFYGFYELPSPGIDVEGVVARSRLLELAAARHVLVPPSAIHLPAVSAYLRGKGLRAVDVRDRKLVVFEQPAALPRAYVAHAVAPAPPAAELLARLSRSDFDPRELSYVEPSSESGAEALPHVEPRRGDDGVRIVRDELNEVELEVRLGAAGLLVLADSFHPGWLAELDGERVPILATNHLFRGVAVPAGDHVVSFRYRPASVALGAVISAVSFAALIAVASHRSGARAGGRA